MRVQVSLPTRTMLALLTGTLLGLCTLWTNPALSQETLKVAFGNALAPWVMPESNDGILLDIISESLEPAGYEVSSVYYPYARRILSYRQGLVDVVSDVNPSVIEREGLDGYFSDIAYSYTNYAISLKHKNYRFKKISDLGQYRILSWQGAVSTLGPEYADMAMNNPFYSEHHNQELQIKMLYLDRVDVIQLDMQIFKYFKSKVSRAGIINTKQEVDIFPLFGKNECGFLFRSIKARDAFNQQLRLLKESGRYDQIYAHYTSTN